MSTQKTADNKLTKKQQVDNTTPTKVMRSMELYSGPIPPASELARYETILPGAANRILTMAEKQSQHRQKMENTMLDANIKAEKNGQIFGFIIFSIAIIAGFLLVLFGRNVEGLISLIVAVGGIVGLFVYNREEVRKELRKKEQLTQNNK